MLKYSWRLLDGYYGVLKLAVRNSSCNSGWLRVVIQCSFGIITVASFIMIVIMSMQRTGDHTVRVSRNSKCSIYECKIVCSHVSSHFFDESDLIQSVLELEDQCPSISLDLVEPLFHYQTIRNAWMVNLEAPITELTIIKGNLNHVEPFAFFGTLFKNVKNLTLLQVTLNKWTSETFLGLQSLSNLKIIQSSLNLVEGYVLRPHKNTLKTLIINKCFTWKPSNVTGTTELQYVSHVDFSENYFTGLRKTSLSQLKNCIDLDLSSSAIMFIEPGTFDNFEKITRIDLSDNKLVRLPMGIFDRLIGQGNLHLQMYLHNNPWLCDCYLTHLLDLNNEGVIAVDPVCTAPPEKSGRYFSSFRHFCKNENRTENESGDSFIETIFMSDPCILRENSRKIVSPVRRHACSRQVANVIEQDLNDLALTFEGRSRDVNPLFFISDEGYTMLELKTSSDYGLVWYRSSCPEMVYCIETVPQHVKLYNVNKNTTYVMCPINSDGHIKDLSCIIYSAKGYISIELSRLRLLFYVLAILIGIGFGAVALYGVIRKNPSLMKGSKRVLLVKHKVADALVLPPTVCGRFDEFDKEHHQKIFNILSAASKVKPNFVKSFSTRSSKSNSPSYVSALQPTEDQLREWRLKHHFDSGSVISTISSSERSISCIFDGDMFYSVQVNKTSQTCEEI